MKPVFIEYVKAGSSVVAIIMAALSLVGWINTTYVEYLKRDFATRSDLERVEHKIDHLLELELNHGK